MANAYHGRSLAGKRQLGRMPPRTMSPISRATPGPVRDALDNPSRGRGAAAAQEAALFYQEQRDVQRNRADALTTQLVDAEARIALLEDELSSAQSSSAPSTRLAAQMSEALEAVRSMSERNRVLAVDLSMAKADVASSQERSAGLQSELDAALMEAHLYRVDRENSMRFCGVWRRGGSRSPGLFL